MKKEKELKIVTDNDYLSNSFSNESGSGGSKSNSERESKETKYLTKHGKLYKGIT